MAACISGLSPRSNLPYNFYPCNNNNVLWMACLMWLLFSLAWFYLNRYTNGVRWLRELTKSPNTLDLYMRRKWYLSMEAQAHTYTLLCLLSYMHNLDHHTHTYTHTQQARVLSHYYIAVTAHTQQQLELAAVTWSLIFLCITAQSICSN